MLSNFSAHTQFCILLGFSILPVIPALSGLINQACARRAYKMPLISCIGGIVVFMTIPLMEGLQDLLDKISQSTYIHYIIGGGVTAFALWAISVKVTYWRHWKMRQIMIAKVPLIEIMQEQGRSDDYILANIGVKNAKKSDISLAYFEVAHRDARTNLYEIARMKALGVTDVKIARKLNLDSRVRGAALNMISSPYEGHDTQKILNQVRELPEVKEFKRRNRMSKAAKSMA